VNRVIGKTNSYQPAKNIKDSGSNVGNHWGYLQQSGRSLLISYHKQMATHPKAHQKAGPNHSSQN
jgi:hypothetical protein